MNKNTVHLKACNGGVHMYGIINTGSHNSQLDEADYIEYISDTAKWAHEAHIQHLSTAVCAARQADKLTNTVEFWKWMQRNYAKSGIFDSPQAMQEYMSKGAGKIEWMKKQLQGKGYEWDWMQNQRKNIKNLFNKFDAGDVANRAASDVTKTNLLTGKTTEYQMKAYTSKTNPDLHNTPKDMTVVTNAEKYEVVKGNGYDHVESFQDSNTINKQVDKRMKQIEKGQATPYYTLKNVGFTMAKAGAVGVVVSASIEGFARWKDVKSGAISKEEYLLEIAKSAGEGGTIGAATAGIMIPISSALTTAGLASMPITIPVSIIVSGAMGKVIAPIFGRGDYRKILGEAKYYKSLMDMNTDLINALVLTTQQFETFMIQYQDQLQVFDQLNNTNAQLNVIHTKANERIEQKNDENQKILDDLDNLINKI